MSSTTREVFELVEILKHHCRQGNVEGVQEEIPKLTRHLHHRELLCPLLYAAIQHGQAGIVGVLLSWQVPITPVAQQLAIAVGSIEMLELFLRSGWNMNSWQGPHHSHVLCYTLGSPHLTRWLLEQGANPNATGELEHTPISHAVQSGSLADIKPLLDFNGDATKGGLLHHAVARQPFDPAVFDLVFSRGASVNALYPEFLHGGGTPLHAAARSNSVDAVRHLLCRGASALCRDPEDRTPLMLALELGCHDEIVLELHHAEEGYQRARRNAVDLTNGVGIAGMSLARGA